LKTRAVTHELLNKVLQKIINAWMKKAEICQQNKTKLSPQEREIYDHYWDNSQQKGKAYLYVDELREAEIKFSGSGKNIIQILCHFKRIKQLSKKCYLLLSK